MILLLEKLPGKEVDMIDTYVSKMEEGLRSRNALNASLKSLHNMIANTNFEKVVQNYSEVYGITSLKESDIKSNPGTSKKTLVPLIGWIGGTIPVYLGTTNGTDADISTITHSLKFDTTDETTDSVETKKRKSGRPWAGDYETTEEGNSFTKEFNGIKVSVKESVVTKYLKVSQRYDNITSLWIINYSITKISKSERSFDFTNADLQILQRI